jgi:hypothetical protein
MLLSSGQPDRNLTCPNDCVKAGTACAHRKSHVHAGQHHARPYLRPHVLHPVFQPGVLVAPPAAHVQQFHPLPLARKANQRWRATFPAHAPLHNKGASSQTFCLRTVLSTPPIEHPHRAGFEASSKTLCFTVQISHYQKHCQAMPAGDGSPCVPGSPLHVRLQPGIEGGGPALEGLRGKL